MTTLQIFTLACNLITIVFLALTLRNLRGLRSGKTIKIGTMITGDAGRLEADRAKRWGA